MSAPSNFQPQNLLQQGRKLPPAVRSRYRKFDIYRDVTQFSFIDNHAIQVSQTEHKTFRDLIWHLVYSPNLVSDLEKARVIFRWMTSKNMYNIDFQSVPKGSPEEVLTSFKNKKGTYARIFETLCGYAGLYCTVLTGFAKGLDYRPGDKFKGTEYNHSWNAVYIDENWYLVDSHWATRYLISEKNMPENLVYEYDDFYFLTDPEQLIYSHWAQKAEWQLLSHPLTLQEFEELPLVKSYFFKCGMFFISHQKGVVQTRRGNISITVGFVKPTNFTYKIVMAENGDEMYQGCKLKSYCLQETRNNQASFTIRSPKAGSFYLTVFAQLLTGDIGVKNVFTAAAEYKVVADQRAGDAVALPNCSDSNWGPGVPVDQLGLIPSHKDAVIPTSDGHVTLEFVKTRPTYILCKLRRPNMKDEELERCITEADQGDKVIVKVTLPASGEYGLEIYGNDPAKDGDTYTHICQYFVHFAKPDAQATAFYMESPDRQQRLGGGPATMDGQKYQPGTQQVTAGLANTYIDGSTKGTQDDFDDLPPPPPELLQQQYLYGAAPQQGVYAQVVAPKQQGVTAFRPGAGATNLPEPKQGKVSTIPVSSTPIQVEKRNIGQEPPAAPPTFKLIPVKQEKDTAPPPTPQTAVTHVKPSLEALDRQVLHTVDDHAIQVSKSDHGSVRELVWDLIYSKNITNEIEKCRVIFRWLATKNLKEMTFDNVERGSPEEVLMGLKTGKTTYAMVFDTMCNYAGLHSKIISGYAKGADYRPGQKFQPGSNQHSWNAVYIYGTWCLIDAHWAARRIIGKQATTEEFHYQLDEYFFLTEPAQLIFTHFPDDPKWQLLERPVTLEEFENMPHMKPQFFKYGLEFVSHRTAVVYGRGEINIRLRYPAHRLVVAFNFSVQFENGDEEYRGIKLNRYGMQESVGGVASFRLRLPKKGSFILYIYAKEDTPENKDNVYAQVCEYKIVQEEVGHEPEPFPPCAYLTWGPNSAFFRYGLATYQQTASVLTRDGKAELQFRIPKAMQFMAKLKHNDRSDAELEGYCMNRIVGNTAYFNITAPSRGEFGLEIYANDPSCEGTTLFHVAQYLIECHEDVKTVPLPKLPAGYLGAQPKFNEFGLNTLTFHDPVIHLERNNVEIQFATAQEMRVTANLIEAESDQDYPDFVFTQTQGNIVSFVVTLPNVGFYKLQLYSIPARDTSQQLPGVFNYLINCKSITQKAIPFPKQYAQWKEGCYMESPLILHPGCGNEVLFRVTVPKAEAVAVVAGSDWTHLLSPQPGLWEGKVDMTQHYSFDGSTKVTLNANYGGDKTSYATLLEYRV